MLIALWAAVLLQCYSLNVLPLCGVCVCVWRGEGGGGGGGLIDQGPAVHLVSNLMPPRL